MKMRADVSDGRYTHASLWPDELWEIRESWECAVGDDGQISLYGYRLHANDAVERGTVLFHAPDCAGVVKVAA